MELLVSYIIKWALNGFATLKANAAAWEDFTASLLANFAGKYIAFIGQPAETGALLNTLSHGTGNKFLKVRVDDIGPWQAPFVYVASIDPSNPSIYEGIWRQTNVFPASFYWSDNWKDFQEHGNVPWDFGTPGYVALFPVSVPGLPAGSVIPWEDNKAYMGLAFSEYEVPVESIQVRSMIFFRKWASRYDNRPEWVNYVFYAFILLFIIYYLTKDE